MKSYFLEELNDAAIAAAALSEVLPGQTNPWLLASPSGDAIAYFNIIANDFSFEHFAGQHVITADISERHFSEDSKVIGVLRLLQNRIGGVLRDDFDSTL